LATGWIVITSNSNEQVKRIRKLHERKERAESGLFYLEGVRIVGDAIEGGAQIEMIVVAPQLRSEYGLRLVSNYRAQGGIVLEVTAKVFERLALKESPQGIAAVVRQNWTALSEINPIPGHPWVVLNSVADPGNLGTILRTNDGAGGEGVILLDQSTDPYDPTAVRASMGALFSQKVVRSTLSEFGIWKQERGIQVIGASDSANNDYHAFQYPERMAVFMGSERQGLQPDALELCDAVVSIPMLGKSDSLNLAAATAVILYEILNQRKEKRMA
jgi:RNA methyltransferase, TrmH family